MVSSIMNTATSGLISTGLATAMRADNTANMVTPGYTSVQPQRLAQNPSGVEVVAKPGGRVELSAELLGLMQEEQNYTANMSSLRTADDIYEELVNLKK